MVPVFKYLFWLMHIRTTNYSKNSACMQCIGQQEITCDMGHCKFQGLNDCELNSSRSK